MVNVNPTWALAVCILVIVIAGFLVWKEQQEIDATSSFLGLQTLGGTHTSKVEISNTDEKIAELTRKIADLEENVNKLLRGGHIKGEEGQRTPAPVSATGSPTNKAKNGETTDNLDHTTCAAFKSREVNGIFTNSGDRIYEMGSSRCSKLTDSTIPVRYWKKADASKSLEVEARIVGCFVDEKQRTWGFFSSRLSNLDPDAHYEYAIHNEKNSPVREFMAPPIVGSTSASEIVLFGDTEMPKAGRLMESVRKMMSERGIVLHVGDSTYATNTGECYQDSMKRDANTPCGWNCVGATCKAVARMSADLLDGKIRTWVRAYDKSFKGSAVWATTMGNHDNDLHWFLSMRPPAAGALPGVEDKNIHYRLPDALNAFAHSDRSITEIMNDAFEYMKMPHFYSFDHGNVHVISIGTEDNPNNAYEQFDGKPLSPELVERFAKHFGPSSDQYKWLENDLKQVQARRDKVPWVILYTHRPLYHTSSHHPLCRAGGDWYACLFRETYEPLLYKYGVNIVASGHSHHYSRSKPMYKGSIDYDRGIVHTVVGTGGFGLTNSFQAAPDWIDLRQGTKFGFAHVVFVNATHAHWRYLANNDPEEPTIEDDVWLVRKP